MLLKDYEGRIWIYPEYNILFFIERGIFIGFREHVRKLRSNFPNKFILDHTKFVSQIKPKSKKRQIMAEMKEILLTKKDNPKHQL